MRRVNIIFALIFVGLGLLGCSGELVSPNALVDDRAPACGAYTMEPGVSSVAVLEVVNGIPVATEILATVPDDTRFPTVAALRSMPFGGRFILEAATQTAECFDWPGFSDPMPGETAPVELSDTTTGIWERVTGTEIPSDIGSEDSVVLAGGLSEMRSSAARLFAHNVIGERFIPGDPMFWISVRSEGVLDDTKVYRVVPVLIVDQTEFEVDGTVSDPRSWVQDPDLRFAKGGFRCEVAARREGSYLIAEQVILRRVDGADRW